MSDAADIRVLRKYRTPIVSDALEHLGARTRTLAYTDATIRSILPSTTKLSISTVVAYGNSAPS